MGEHIELLCKFISRPCHGWQTNKKYLLLIRKSNLGSITLFSNRTNEDLYFSLKDFLKDWEF